MNENIYLKNLEKWALRHPKEAVQFSYLDTEGTDFIPSKTNVPNLNTEIGILHAEDDPLAEVNRWFESLHISNEQVIYVYGIGLGYAYLAAKNWLKANPDHYLIFLEDNPQVLAKFFETELASEILSSSQVYVEYFRDLDDHEGIFLTLYWAFLKMPFIVSALPVYAEKKKEVYALLKYKLTYDNAVKNALVDEYLIYGVPFFKNFYPNILDLVGAYLGTKLFGKFENIPAIICGAGPSMEKHVNQLKDLKNKAFIFSGGSSLNVLTKHGIFPHFGAGIDPNPAQYLRLSSNQAFELPFFYRNRLHREAFKTIRGPRLYIPGSGGYEVSKWFEGQVGIESDFIDEGHNVINFCLTIATLMGCRPIIFLGMDLAYTDMKAYAEGVVDDASVKQEELHSSESVQVDDIYGNRVNTLWKWVAESNWIGDFACMHMQTDILNGTEGGIGFPGIKNIPFNTIQNEYLQKEYDLSGMIHTEIQNSALTHITKEKMHQLLNEFRESMLRSEEHLKTLMYESEKLDAKIQEYGKVAADMKSGLTALSEHELEEEIAYEYLLQIFNEVYTRVLSRKLTQLRVDHQEEKAAILGKHWLQREKLMFLYQTARFNRELIDMTLNNSPYTKGEDEGADLLNFN